MKVASSMLRRGLLLVSDLVCPSRRFSVLVLAGARPCISDMIVCCPCLLLPLWRVRVDSSRRAYFMTCAGVSANLIRTLWFMQYLLAFS